MNQRAKPGLGCPFRPRDAFDRDRFVMSRREKVLFVLYFMELLFVLGKTRITGDRSLD